MFVKEFVLNVLCLLASLPHNANIPDVVNHILSIRAERALSRTVMQV